MASISLSGQGQRCDRPHTWNTQFSGTASPTAIKLTGTVSRQSPCVIELSNTRPAPYSFASAEIAGQNQIAHAEAERLAVGAERQRDAAAAPEPQPNTSVIAAPNRPQPYHSVSASAQGFDGRWEGYYVCSGHALRPEWGAFAWQRVTFNVANSQISGRRDFINNLNIPRTAVFNGRVDRSGSVKIDVVTDAKEDFHQTLEGRTVSPGVIKLTGLMLNPKGTPVRDCRLTLRLSAPTQAAAIVQSVPAPSAKAPVIVHQDATEEEPQRLEAQRQAIETQRQQVVEAAKRAAAEKREAAAQAQTAAEDRKAAEEARRQTEELQRWNAPRPRQPNPRQWRQFSPLGQQPTPMPPPSPQETSSSNPLSVMPEIGILAVILLGGIVLTS